MITDENEDGGQSDFFSNACTVALLLINKWFYFSLRIIFVDFLHNKLILTEWQSVVIFHGFQSCIYVTTIIAKHILDHRCIKIGCGIITFVYFCGIGTFLGMTLVDKWIDILFPIALVCITLGCGGIQAISIDFFDVQFEGSQTKQTGHIKRGTIILLFFITVTAIVWPFVIQTYSCFGYPDCYWFYFAVFLIIFTLFTILFLVSLQYNHHLLENGMILERNFIKVFIIFLSPIYYILKWKILRVLNKKEIDPEEEEIYYLEYAEQGFTSAEVDNTRKLWKVCHLMLPLIIFWACIEQQSSKWVFSAYRTDRRYGFLSSSYASIHPAHFQLFTPSIFLIFLPLLDILILPFMSTCGLRTKRKKIVFSGVFILYAMFLSGIVAFIQYDQEIGPNLKQIDELSTTIVSGINFKTQLAIRADVNPQVFNLDRLEQSVIKVKIKDPFVTLTLKLLEQSNMSDFEFITENENPDLTETIFIKRSPGEDSTNLIENRKFCQYKRTKTFKPGFRIFYANRTKIYDAALYTITNILWMPLPLNVSQTRLVELDPGYYKYSLNANMSEESFEVRFGAIYNVVVFVDGGTCNLRFNEVLRPITMKFYWIIPQYIVMAFGELLFGVQAIKFFISQDQDPEIRQTIIIFWYLTIALGNVLVISVNSLSFLYFKDDFQFCFCGMMVFAIVIFAFMNMAYNPRPGTDDNPSQI